jgi:hypothetical protein
VKLYNCSYDYLYSFCIVCPLLCVCSFVCCVSFDRAVILCDVCYLFVVSYCKPLPAGKTHLQLIKVTLHYIRIPCCMVFLSKRTKVVLTRLYFRTLI